MKKQWVFNWVSVTAWNWQKENQWLIHKHKHKNIYLPTHIHIYIFTCTHPSPISSSQLRPPRKRIVFFRRSGTPESFWERVVFQELMKWIRPLFLLLIDIYFFLNKHVPGLRRTSKSTFFLCSSTLHGKQLFRNVSARKWCTASGSPRPAFIQPRRWKRPRWRSGVSADCGNSM